MREMAQKACAILGLALALTALAGCQGSGSSSARSPEPVFSKNLYARAAVPSAGTSDGCAAYATETMLNLIALDSPSKVAGFSWQIDLSYKTQKALMVYGRDNMTMLASSAGIDAHGMRNILNFYGWGDQKADVYEDRAYVSFEAASKAAIIALAQTDKPVGIVSLAGLHAVLLNGYTVAQADPATGTSDFVIRRVFLTDMGGARNVSVSSDDWRNGPVALTFAPYVQTDSVYRDPIDGHIGSDEWQNKWVLVLPVR